MEKKKIIITVASVVAALGLILLVVGGIKGAGDKNPSLKPGENGTVTENTEDISGDLEEIGDSDTEIGSDSDVITSTEVEDVTGTGDGESSQNPSQNGSEQNTTNQNNSNQNNSNQNATNKKPTNKTDEVGLSKEDYEYVSQSNSGSSKEKQLAQKIANKIIKSGMSDFEKVKAINDYMILNVTYDRENYNKNTIPYESYTALGAMEKKVAVCAGYAKMFKLVAEAAGLSATYVVGDTPYGYHGWNQVKVDGKWYNIDTTWNDGDYETRESGHYYCGCYEYFLLSNADFEKTHTPHGKVNKTGNSRDFEGVKTGCPYDGKLPYCETQADVTKVVKSMVNSNVMQKRIMTNNSSKIKTMVESALTELKVYGGYTVSIEDKVQVYLESTSGVYNLTINIALESSSFDEAKMKKASSVADAKRICEEEFKKPLPENTTVLGTFYLYVTPQYVNNNDFKTELMRWAFYEKKMSLVFLDEWEKIDESTYRVRVGRSSAAESQSAYEHIYHTKDIEAAIKRMFQYGYKKISLYIQPSNYQLTGSFNEAGYAFENTFCKPLNEKYCLRSDWDQVHPDENEICVYFSAEGHDVDYVDWEIQKAATCVSEGLQVKYCKICHQVAEKKSIPKDDNHDYYWDTKGSNRTRRCHSCSYTGIKEVCVGGVWGYYDDAAAKEKIKTINERRSQHTIWDLDPYGNVLGSRAPAALVESNELKQKAMGRLSYYAPLDINSFRTTEADEFISKMFENRHDKKHTETCKGGVSEDRGMLDEKYGSIGVVCFYYDHDNDGKRMMPIYIIEFGPAN